MKRTLTIILGAIVFGSVFPAPVSAHSVPGTIIIHMEADKYTPNTVTIPKGTQVVFENASTEDRWPASNLHPTHTLYSEFDPKGSIKPGESWSFVFDKPGIWKMHDHLKAEISGTITVTDTAATTDAAPGTQQKKLNVFLRTWKSIAGFFSKLFNRQKTTDTTAQGEDIKLIPIEKGDERIFTDDTALASYLKKFGPKDTITSLRLMEQKFGSCHQPAHRAGHLGYKLFGDEAFQEYSAECQSGYYHGVIEAYFKDKGTADLKATLSRICGNEQNGFFEHQCVHGVGHGLLAWSNYELPEALAACDLLERRQDSCWTGAFMENQGAKLATDKTTSANDVGSTDIHLTKYLSADPHYPCSAIDDKYKNSCYFLQTSRMLQLFGLDFKKVAETCSEAPEIYQASCFGSMGRDVGGAYPRDMRQEITACGNVKKQDMRVLCLNGAVQNSFWDPTGQDLAISFCKLLTASQEKSPCYGTIIYRARDLLNDAGTREAFCNKIEPAYLPQCKEVLALN